ncbi:MAG: hypothetical protein KGI37_08980 [Alphaproteobacteria bacterium]|nr:hypothetical protein [Alphaproteobacteria bacterium]
MFYDINKLPEDGYLILPISISRIEKGQSPEVCYEVLEYFEGKLSRFGLDVVILYTDGLYFNNDQSAITIRKRTNEKVASHKNRLESMIIKSHRFMPQAFHYLPWDYALLNSDNFQGNFNKLMTRYKKDPELRRAVMCDLGNRPASAANIGFVLEEVVVTHLMRQKLVSLPRTLVKEDNFRIIIYPGEYVNSDFYQFKHGILPINKKLGKRGYPYGAGHYNFDQKIFYDFRKLAAVYRDAKELPQAVNSA